MQVTKTETRGVTNKIEHRGNDLVQALLDEAHQPYRDHNRDNMTLMTDQRISYNHEYRLMAAERRSVRTGPCVLQVGVNHNHTDNRAEEKDFFTKYLGTEYAIMGRKVYAVLANSVANTVDRTTVSMCTKTRCCS